MENKMIHFPVSIQYQLFPQSKQTITSLLFPPPLPSLPHCPLALILQCRHSLRERDEGKDPSFSHLVLDQNGQKANLCFSYFSATSLTSLVPKNTVIEIGSLFQLHDLLCSTGVNLFLQQNKLEKYYFSSLSLSFHLLSYLPICISSMKHCLE